MEKGRYYELLYALRKVEKELIALKPSITKSDIHRYNELQYTISDLKRILEHEIQNEKIAELQDLANKLSSLI